MDDIPGIGPARRKALMRTFKDIEAIRNAEVAELAGVPQMNERAARQVYEFFHRPPAAGNAGEGGEDGGEPENT